MIEQGLQEQPIRILHLEDNPDDAEMCMRSLGQSGLDFRVKRVSKADEFKTECESRHYDVILGDYRLPGWTGLEAVRWLRSSGSIIPFILVTGELGSELAVECIKEGADDYVLKANLVRLPFAVRRAVDEARVRRQRDKAEQQYFSIVREAPYGVCRVDQPGRILMANPILTVLLGYQTEVDILRLNLANDIYVKPEQWQEMVNSIELSTRVHGAEFVWRRKDGKTIIVRVDGRWLETEPDEGPMCEMFVQDITEQRTLEQQFHQAQKMEAIGRLAGGVAHDFNNLLMIIRGSAELLDHHKANQQRISGYIKQINDATSIAASVVQQLMAFSRKQVPQKSSLDFNVVLRDLRKMLPRLLGEDIQTVFTPGQALERVSADRAQIEQIILNLAINARDAMPSGGKLVIETGSIVLSMPKIEKGGVELPPGKYVWLSVADSGTGMTADVQSHIFEPFFTTKEPGKGTGLGLATVYGIVREYEGVIGVDSTPGKGTAFNIYFPADGAAKETVTAPRAPVAPGGSETILLVEDEAALRELTCEYLRSRGYQVLWAANGLQALEICRTHETPIDILMTDVIMPGIRGPELVKAALEMRPGMHVVYLSGYVDRGIEDGALGRDAIFLAKPYSFDELSHTIRRAASGPASRPVKPAAFQQ
jgi:two-component system cell cycle sensor histidine kinase/response regulator CckA